MFVEFRARSIDGYVTNSSEGTEDSICIFVNAIRTDRTPKTTDIDYWNGVELRLRHCCDILCPRDIAGEFYRIVIQQSSPSCLMTGLIRRQFCSQCSDFVFNWNMKIQIQSFWELQTNSRANILVLLCLVVSTSHFRDHLRRNVVVNG